MTLYLYLAIACQNATYPYVACDVPCWMHLRISFGQIDKPSSGSATKRVRNHPSSFLYPCERGHLIFIHRIHVWYIPDYIPTFG